MNKILKTSSHFFLIGACLVATHGCGGSSTVGSASSPKVTIDWPEQTRGVAAPPYATSAKITLEGASSTGTNLVWIANRPSSTSASSISYPGPANFRPGATRLSVEFYSNTGAEGLKVASAAASANLTNFGFLNDSAGAPLPTVTFMDATAAEKEGSSLVITADVEVGKTVPLSLKLTGKDGQIIAVAPGVLSNVRANKEGIVRVNPDGTVTGLDDGFTVVTASLGNINSSPRDSGVSAFLPEITSSRFVNIPVSEVTKDPLSRNLWAVLKNENAVVLVDTVAGSVLRKFNFSEKPTTFVVSNDGTELFVLMQSSESKIHHISSTSGELIEPVISVSAFVWDIALSPDKTTFAYSRGSTVVTRIAGVTNTNTLGLFAMKLRFLDANTIIAEDQFSKRPLVDCRYYRFNGAEWQEFWRSDVNSPVAGLNGEYLVTQAAQVLNSINFNLHYLRPDHNAQSQGGARSIYASSLVGKSMYSVGSRTQNTGGGSEGFVYAIRIDDLDSKRVKTSFRIITPQPDDRVFGRILPLGNKGIAVVTLNGFLVVDEIPGL